MKNTLRRTAKTLRRLLQLPELEQQLAVAQAQLGGLQAQLGGLQRQLADQEVRVTAILALLLNQQQLTVSQIAVLQDVIAKAADRIRVASPRGDGDLVPVSSLTGTPEIGKDL